MIKFMELVTFLYITMLNKPFNKDLLIEAINNERTLNEKYKKILQMFIVTKMENIKLTLPEMAELSGLNYVPFFQTVRKLTKKGFLIKLSTKDYRCNEEKFELVINDYQKKQELKKKFMKITNE